MSRFDDFPKQINVPIPTDDTGMVGRECPNAECEGYFKLQPGTGLTGEDLDCVCPYCGHRGKPDQFWTKEQIEYAKSYAFRAIGDIVTRQLKKLEFNHPPRGAFGIGISMTLKEGPRAPLRHYREKALETEVVCDQCTLRYSVFGVFGFCPDCGCHNSRQILEKNLDLAMKVIEFSQAAPTPEITENLVQNALEDVVSAFDGFGRELLASFAAGREVSAEAMKKASQSFQPLCTGGSDSRINIDGLLKFTGGRAGAPGATAYCQVFRSGIVEGVTTEVVQTREPRPYIASQWLAQEVVSSVKQYRAGLIACDVLPPYLVLATLAGAKGATLAVSNRFMVWEHYPVDRDLVVLPDVLIESRDSDLLTDLRSLFDGIWNACGWVRCFDYNEQGKWAPPA